MKRSPKRPISPWSRPPLPLEKKSICIKWQIGSINKPNTYSNFGPNYLRLPGPDETAKPVIYSPRSPAPLDPWPIWCSCSGVAAPSRMLRRNGRDALKAKFNWTTFTDHTHHPAAHLEPSEMGWSPPSSGWFRSAQIKNYLAVPICPTRPFYVVVSVSVYVCGGVLLPPYRVHWLSRIYRVPHTSTQPPGTVVRLTLLIEHFNLLQKT